MSDNSEAKTDIHYENETATNDTANADTVVIDEETLKAAAAAGAKPVHFEDSGEPEASAAPNPQAAKAAQAYSKVADMKPEDFASEENASAEAAPEEKPAEGPDYKEIALRTTAEFENYRKRVARERVEWQRDVLARFLKDFLPAFDDLDRTIAESEKNQSVESVCEGVKLARANLWKTMEGAGIKEIDAKGKKFDPRFHEALSMIPMPGAEPNTVVDVFKPGYMINDFVVRAAQVVVAAEVPQS